MSAITKNQLLSYVQENGIPEEMMVVTTGDGYQLRKEGEKYVFFYQEHGSRSDVKIFDDWDTLLPFLVDHYFNERHREWKKEERN